jgi:hypothetical protein
MSTGPRRTGNQPQSNLAPPMKAPLGRRPGSLNSWRAALSALTIATLWALAVATSQLLTHTHSPEGTCYKPGSAAPAPATRDRPPHLSPLRLHRTPVCPEIRYTGQTRIIRDCPVNGRLEALDVAGFASLNEPYSRGRHERYPGFCPVRPALRR